MRLKIPAPAPWVPEEVFCRFVVPGEPTSKARARFTKTGKAYTPAQTKAAEAAVALAFRAATRGHQVDATSAFGVVAQFYAATHQRRDLDNMLKLICDGLNKVCWDDDSQVVEAAVRKTYVDDPADARTEVLIYRCGQLHRMEKPCQQCGTLIPVHRSTVNRIKYCSRACASAGKTKPESERAPKYRTWPARPCEHCGSMFEPTYAKARWCSRPCMSQSKTVEVACDWCGTRFRTPQSWAKTRVRQLCGDQCRSSMAAVLSDTCIRGHLKAEFYVRTAKGKAYCRECSRLRFPKIEAAQ